MKKLTKEQVKEIWKNHKREILIGGAAMIGGTALLILTGNKIKKAGVKIINSSPSKPYTKLDIPESVALVGVGEVSSKNFDEYADIWLNNTSFRDLGDFGKALVDAYGWDPDSSITGVVSTGFVAGD